jgi:hypothetical protein
MRLWKPATSLLLTMAIAAAIHAGGAAQGRSGGQPQALHSAEQVARWFEASSPAALALPGTVFATHDENNGRIVFGVEHPIAIQAVRTVVQNLGIPESAFSVQVAPPIYALATLRERVRPAIAGLQIHFGNFLCSLGFNADAGGARSMITASHCTNIQGGVEGTQYFQPTSTVDPTVIATEADDPTYFRGGRCPRGRKCRFSDSSRALYSGAVASTRGSIARTSGPNNGSLDIVGDFTVTSQDNTTTSFGIGTTLNKVGRTTGWTQGNVTTTCADTNVSGTKITLLCQTFVQNPGGAVVVQGGDSGSGVFRLITTSNAEIVGILWGGNGNGTLLVFSPLKSIQDELGPLTVTQ